MTASCRDNRGPEGHRAHPDSVKDVSRYMIGWPSPPVSRYCVRAAVQAEGHEVNRDTLAAISGGPWCRSRSGHWRGGSANHWSPFVFVAGAVRPSPPSPRGPHAASRARREPAQRVTSHSVRMGGGASSRGSSKVRAPSRSAQGLCV